MYVMHQSCKLTACVKVGRLAYMPQCSLLGILYFTVPVYRPIPCTHGRTHRSAHTCAHGSPAQHGTARTDPPAQQSQSSGCGTRQSAPAVACHHVMFIASYFGLTLTHQGVCLRLCTVHMLQNSKYFRPSTGQYNNIIGWRYNGWIRWMIELGTAAMTAAEGSTLQVPTTHVHLAHGNSPAALNLFKGIND